MENSYYFVILYIIFLNLYLVLHWVLIWTVFAEPLELQL